jgi:hypothetical protein
MSFVKDHRVYTSEGVVKVNDTRDNTIVYLFAAALFVLAVSAVLYVVLG